MGRFRDLRFWLAAVLMVAAMAAVQFTTVREESQTSDEGRQLYSGYAYLDSGRFTVGIEHPPLLKLLWALPVWHLHPTVPRVAARAGATADEIDSATWDASSDFLYRNRAPADDLLMAGRCSAIAVSALLGLAIAFWSRRWFGDAAGLLALLIYVLDPNFLANGRYIKNDVGAALGIFAATLCWGGYLEKPSGRKLGVAGIVLGLALGMKNSAAIVVPVMAILYVFQEWRETGRVKPWPFARRFAIVGSLAFFVVLLAYRFDALTYLRGLVDLGGRQTGNTREVSFLMGRASPNGWWYMSPVSFAVKTPLGEMALMLLALGVALPVIGRRLRAGEAKGIGMRWLAPLAGILGYGAVAVLTHVNVGERHLLPLYPFLYVLVAGLLTRPPAGWWRGLAVAGCVGVLAFETASIHPHYLAFFNALAGGPEGGREILVDSNLDWGQDLKNLKRYMEANGIPEVCLSYYGSADPDYYGIRHRDFLARTPEEVNELNCVVAASVTHLAIRVVSLAGMKELIPDALIGYSIYVYDLRQPKPH